MCLNQIKAKLEEIGVNIADTTILVDNDFITDLNNIKSDSNLKVIIDEYTWIETVENKVVLNAHPLLSRFN